MVTVYLTLACNCSSDGPIWHGTLRLWLWQSVSSLFSGPVASSVTAGRRNGTREQ